MSESPKRQIPQKLDQFRGAGPSSFEGNLTYRRTAVVACDPLSRAPHCCVTVPDGSALPDPG